MLDYLIQKVDFLQGIILLFYGKDDWNLWMTNSVFFKQSHGKNTNRGRDQLKRQFYE